MPKLHLHQHEIKIIFDLLGHEENDITRGLGWTLAKCDKLRELFLKQFFSDYEPKAVASDIVSLQTFKSDGNTTGYTDIEIETEKFHVIVEAKRGWDLPSDTQLQKYAAHLVNGYKNPKLVVIAQATCTYAQKKLSRTVLEIPVEYLSWKDIAKIIDQSRSLSNNACKLWLQEMSDYLRGLMNMQNQRDNMVFVVPLGQGSPTWASIT